MKEDDSHPASTVFSYIVVLLIIAALNYWANHVLHWRQFTYWQWCILSAGWCIAAWLVKPLRYIAGATIAICVILQFAAWAGVLTLPLIKP